MKSRKRAKNQHGSATLRIFKGSYSKVERMEFLQSSKVFKNLRLSLERYLNDTMPVIAESFII